MDELESLNHTKWACKYHVVFIPKCRRKTLYVQLRRYLGEVFRRLAEQKESRIEEGHLIRTSHCQLLQPLDLSTKYQIQGCRYWLHPGGGVIRALFHGMNGFSIQKPTGSRHSQPRHLHGHIYSQFNL